MLYPVKNSLGHSRFWHKRQRKDLCPCWQLNSAPGASSQSFRFVQLSKVIGGFISLHFSPIIFLGFKNWPQFTRTFDWRGLPSVALF